VQPIVSICVPNLNTLPFLPERFDTIFGQTLKDWELLVYDGYSNDGAWEYICGLTNQDSRIKAWQGPRQGTPGSWTPCVQAAQGKYVYIATSDDTMPPDCLETLVNALENHPECDVAHCNLRVIDEHGRDGLTWWSEASMFSVSSGELISHPHIRKAPYDGMLHLLGEPVYISITQLLIRRSLFDRIGFFESKWGAVGDFHWCMKAGLAGNTIHVPQTWGGWRVHGTQATAGARVGSPDHAAKVDGMIEDAIARSEECVSPSVRKLLAGKWSVEAAEIRSLIKDIARCDGSLERRALVMRRLLSGSRAARVYLKARLPGIRRWREMGPDFIHSLLADAGIDSTLVPVTS
jgi:glycosyltransferase involved in cell wall biosynthesis